MPDLVAQYESLALPVIDVVDGVPFVFFEGRTWAAADLRPYGQPLDGIEFAPTVVPAPAGLVAEFLDSYDTGAPARVVAYPVIAINTTPGSSWAEILIAIGPEIDLVSGRDGDTHRYLGLRQVGGVLSDTDAVVAQAAP